MEKTPDQYVGSPEFVHLTARTVYSKLVGCAQPEQYAAKCSELGFPAIAITERGNMASVPDMYFACKKKKIKYIPGCQIFYNDYEPYRQSICDQVGKYNELRTTNEDLYKRINRNRDLTILCKNEEGFHNLIKLTTLATKDGFFHRPRVWFERLLEYKAGLIVLSGGMTGPVGYEFQLDFESLELEKKPHKRSSGELWSDKNGLQYARQFKEAFGDDFYIELNMPRMPELYDDKVFRITAQVGAKEGIKCVISNTCTYISREDNYLQRIMAAIDQKKTIKDPSLFYEDTEELYFKTRAELWATYHNGGYGKGLPEDSFDKFCDTSLEIAVKCDEFIPDVTMKIPDWSDVEPGKDADEELYRLVYEGLKRKNLFDDQTKFWTDGKHVTYKEQADIECDRFVSKGFASYLLITQDIINHGRSLGYPFGARGSAGGSLACYALDIHHINPQLWELSFDRFMASSRGGYMLNVSMK